MTAHDEAVRLKIATVAMAIKLAIKLMLMKSTNSQNNPRYHYRQVDKSGAADAFVYFSYTKSFSEFFILRFRWLTRPG